jgi:hypothetical protein
MDMVVRSLNLLWEIRLSGEMVECGRVGARGIWVAQGGSMFVVASANEPA